MLLQIRTGTIITTTTTNNNNNNNNNTHLFTTSLNWVCYYELEKPFHMVINFNHH